MDIDDGERILSGGICLDPVKMVSIRQRVRERERLFSGPGAAGREAGLLKCGGLTVLRFSGMINNQLRR